MAAIAALPLFEMGTIGGMELGSFTLGNALSLGGTMLGAAGALSSGNAMASTANYNAQVEQVRAQDAQAQAQAQAAQLAVDNKRKMGETAAAYGASGVEMTGTPLEVMSDQAATGELARQLALYRGTVSANSANQQALLDQAQAQMYESRGVVQAGTTLLTGLGGTFGKTYAGSTSTPSPGGGPKLVAGGYTSEISY